MRELYGRAPAAEFGPKALAAVREAMVRKGWSRPYCNAQVRRVVRVFKWAAGEEIVGAPLYAALRTLAPLRAEKTDAAEGEPRQPADRTTSPPPCPSCRRTSGRYSNWCG